MLLLESIAPGHISRKQALAEQDWEKRATAILRTAKLIGCRMLITPRDISEVTFLLLISCFYYRYSFLLPFF